MPKGHAAFILNELYCPRQKVNHTAYIRVTCCDCDKNKPADLSTVLTHNYSPASQRGFNRKAELGAIFTLETG